MAEEEPKHHHSLFHHHKEGEDGPVDYEKEEKHYKHEEHDSELGALAAGAFALGSALHLIARSSIAHCVVPKLCVGGVYTIRRFTVAPNKKMYRLRRDDDCLIQLESNSAITKVENPGSGFLHQPFALMAIEEIASHGSKYLIDVIGRVVDFGVCKPTRNGSQFLEFNLLNERGRCIKVTLWGSLATELTKRNNNPDALYIVLLPALNVREYRGMLQLSSTSGTQIFDSDDIPEVAALRQMMCNNPVAPLENHGTLLQILELGREQHGVTGAASVSMHCNAKIDRIFPRTPWNYNSCGENGCKKGLKPVGTQFWCDSCEKICEFPILRYRLRLEVSDSTTALTVTMFDEVVESVMKKSAVAMMSELEDGDDEAEFPEEIQQLVGKLHMFELKSHTYYNHGEFESFTVSRVTKADSPAVKDSSIATPPIPQLQESVANVSLLIEGNPPNEEDAMPHGDTIDPTTTDPPPNQLKRKFTVYSDADV